MNEIKRFLEEHNLSSMTVVDVLKWADRRLPVLYKGNRYFLIDLSPPGRDGKVSICDFRDRTIGTAWRVNPADLLPLKE